MAKRARFSVHIDGTNITSALDPVLNALTISLKVGGGADTATLEIDDTDGRVVLPKTGAAIQISLGWQGGAQTVSFMGTVDDVTSAGGGSGRSLSIKSTSADMRGDIKAPQQRHFDDMTIAEILRAAGEAAGIASVEIDPALGDLRRAYLDMRDESFAALGERLSREIGGAFRIIGGRAIMTARKGSFTGVIRAAWGDNLHSWSMTPDRGRPAFSTARARTYDLAQAAWGAAEAATGLSAPAALVSRFPRADAAEAEQQAQSDAETSQRDRGGGTVTIEGAPEAQPDAMCALSGARVGVDGVYRIEAVNHRYGGSGFTTSLTLAAPSDGAGGSPADPRAADVAGGAAPPYLDPDVNEPQ